MMRSSNGASLLPRKRRSSSTLMAMNLTSWVCSGDDYICVEREGRLVCISPQAGLR